MRAPSFVGHVDAIENGEVYGWALSLIRPSEPVTVSLYLDGVFATEALAAYYRPDVAKALSCTGRNGFYIDLEGLSHTDRPKKVDVRFPNGKLLEGGPLLYRPPREERPPQRRTLLFMHIPKTAGTAFREVVLPNYKQSQVAYIYGDPPGFPSNSVRDIPLAQRARLRLIFGHYGYGVHGDMPLECDYAAVIRDPLPRIWSHYHHLVRDNHPVALCSDRPKHIESMLEEGKSIHLDNLYVRYFCGLEESLLPPGAITREVYELALLNSRRPNVYLAHSNDLTSAYNTLAEGFGWIRGLECPWMNRSPQPALVPNAKQEQAIRHFNAWDFKLHENMVNARHAYC